MRSRRPLILGLIALAAIVAACLWLVRRDSDAGPSTVTTGSPQPVASGSEGSGHELAPSERVAKSGALSTPAGSPAGAAGASARDGRQVAPPSAAGQQAAGTVVPTAVVEVAAPVPVTAADEAQTPSALNPILGGTSAFQSHHAASTYAERRERAELLESSLSSESGEKERELYEALKAELVWLRANPGTPPK